MYNMYIMNNKILKYFEENSIDNYIKKIVNCKDNDACWCDSGKKYKDCHKLYKGKDINNGRTLYLLSKLKNKKMCLHPDKDKCNGKIIDAHSIQNSKSLESICENGMVYRFEINSKTIDDWDKYRSIEPKKEGKAKTSIFKGFCSYHDQELFKKIDIPSIMPTKEQSLLLSIRSFAKEIYAKSIIFNIDDIYKESQVSDDPHLLAISQDMSKSFQEGNKLGIEDLFKHYANIFHIYKNNEYERVNRLIIKIKDIPEAICSSCFAPEYDMEGNILQNIITSDTLEYLSFEVFVENRKGIIQLCWYDNFKYCKEFANSILNKDDIPNTIFKMIFQFSENHAFNISWYDSLPVLKKKGIMNLMMLNIASMMNIENDKYILNDRKKYVNWNIEEIIKDY